jgi:hypothetical protein
MIQRKISRALVLNLLWQTKWCSGTAQDDYALDRAFSLIEGTLSKSVALQKSVQFGKGLAPNSKCRQLFVLAKW